MVRRGRLELPRPEAHAPEACVSTNSTIGAYYMVGVAGFEPAAFRPPGERANRAALYSVLLSGDEITLNELRSESAFLTVINAHF